MTDQWTEYCQDPERYLHKIMGKERELDRDRERRMGHKSNYAVKDHGESAESRP